MIGESEGSSAPAAPAPSKKKTDLSAVERRLARIESQNARTLYYLERYSPLFEHMASSARVDLGGELAPPAVLDDEDLEAEVPGDAEEEGAEGLAEEGSESSEGSSSGEGDDDDSGDE